MITLNAPAKINLTLEVLGKRPDGYHEIRSIMQTVSLADTLSFDIAGELSFRSDLPEWSGDKSLVSQAAALLKEKTGVNKGASLFVQKRIPLLSGLGGDSSDVVAALIGLNGLWELGLGREELISIGRQLGSDVTFFFHGGTALAKGRGETVAPLFVNMRKWIVLAFPPVRRFPGKTKALYQTLNSNHYTDGTITQRLLEAIKAGAGFENVDLYNTFENVAFDLQPELETARRRILKMGPESVHLAGSGPTMFILCQDSR